MFANNHDYGKGTNMFKTIIIDDNKVLADISLAGNLDKEQL